MTKHIPNVLTSINLVFGFLAIILSFRSTTLIYAPYLIFAATIIDFLDGFAARLFDAHTSLGKQLDSLADMVSFGIAPGILAFQLVNLTSLGSMFTDHRYLLYSFLLLPSLIPLFSALRLAKFNIDENQTDSFIGLATPSSAILIASTLLVYLTTENTGLQNFILNKITLTSLIILDSYLMVSNIPMFSLKFKSASFKANKTQYIFIGFAVALFAVLKFYAIPLIICSYILASIMFWTVKPKNA